MSAVSTVIGEIISKVEQEHSRLLRERERYANEFVAIENFELYNDQDLLERFVDGVNRYKEIKEELPRCERERDDLMEKLKPDPSLPLLFFAAGTVVPVIGNLTGLVVGAVERYQEKKEQGIRCEELEKRIMPNYKNDLLDLEKFIVMANAEMDARASRAENERLQEIIRKQQEEIDGKIVIIGDGIDEITDTVNNIIDDLTLLDEQEDGEIGAAEQYYTQLEEDLIAEVNQLDVPESVKIVMRAKIVEEVSAMHENKQKEIADKYRRAREPRERALKEAQMKLANLKEVKDALARGENVTLPQSSSADSKPSFSPPPKEVFDEARMIQSKEVIMKKALEAKIAFLREKRIMVPTPNEQAKTKTIPMPQKAAAGSQVKKPAATFK
ncbi:MAG: hypothetical protein LBJ09_03385 [Clostridiales bacterium]|jgi:hypothetical protein|nr:hypothetical protein [Clostridiales bacterium]